MIMEDDVAPDLGFLSKYETCMKELENVPNWEMLLLARNKVHIDEEEPDVENTKHWVHPGFNSWSLHYILTDSGKSTIKLKSDLVVLVAELLRPSIITYGMVWYCMVWSNFKISFYSGVDKLLALDPLTKLVPLDLFLAISYGKYDSDKVNRHFHPKNVITLATKVPLSVPAKLWVDDDYVSDTGKSGVTHYWMVRGVVVKSMT